MNRGRPPKKRQREVKFLVRAIMQEYSEWTYKEIHQELKKRIRGWIGRTYTHWPEIRREDYINEITPSLSTIKNWYPKSKSEDPLEKPWTMITTKEYPISPSAIKIMFEVKSWSQYDFTIRQALWIDRLSSLPLSSFVITKYAMMYATNEITHFPEDSTKIDDMLLKTLKDPKEAFETIDEYYKKHTINEEELILRILEEEEINADNTNQ